VIRLTFTTVVEIPDLGHHTPEYFAEHIALYYGNRHQDWDSCVVGSVVAEEISDEEGIR